METRSAILIAEDDDDDFLLTKKALQDCGFAGPVRRARDGEELLAILLDDDAHEAEDGLLVLLDLNMPRKDGMQALRELKAHPRLRRIPVVVLTTSTSELDVSRSYELGASSFVSKPAAYDRFLEFVRSLTSFWLDAAVLPRRAAVREAA